MTATRQPCRIAALLALCLTASARNYYVATTGSVANDGSVCRPWTLQYALTNATVAAGDTIWLRGGTYANTSVRGTLNGTVSQPIVVRGYANETPRLDGLGAPVAALQIWGGNTVYRDFEVFNSSTTRTLETPERPFGVYLDKGTNVVCLNLTVHDNGNGFFFGPEATNSVIYGCVIYNNGWQEPDRGHGHGIYAQSYEQLHAIKDCVIANNFGLGIQFYSESTVALEGITILGNTVFNNGSLATNGTRYANILAGGLVTARNVRVDQNYTWHSIGNYPNLKIGESPFVNSADALARSNYVAGGYTTWINWMNLNFTANTLAQSTVQAFTIGGTTNTVDGNAYYETSGAPPFQLNYSSYHFAPWQAASGWDATSTYSGSAPAATVSFVRPSSYASGRGNVTVYNWAGTDNVSVDLSSVLTAGRQFQVRNAANWTAGAILSGTYAGGTVSLPMTNLTAAVPVGLSAPAATGPGFNAFVVMTR